MIVLLTNDDGISAPGIKALKTILLETQGISRVITVAPSYAQSGIGGAITEHKPVPWRKVGSDEYEVDGTSVDAVLVAMSFGIDFGGIFSGINNGHNVGPFIWSSGTFMAAFQGVRLCNIPFGIALSAESTKDMSTEHLIHTKRVVDLLLKRKDVQQPVYNVNIASQVSSETLVKNTTPTKFCIPGECNQKEGEYVFLNFYLEIQHCSEPDTETDVANLEKYTSISTL